jgi:ribosome-binding factor A
MPNNERDPVRDRKQRQLCAAVGQALEWALWSASDPWLQACTVTSVRPWPSQARLRVLVECSEPVDPLQLQERLSRATPWLRGQLAEHLSRRRVPELIVDQVL